MCFKFPGRGFGLTAFVGTYPALVGLRWFSAAETCAAAQAMWCRGSHWSPPAMILRTDFCQAFAALPTRHNKTMIHDDSGYFYLCGTFEWVTQSHLRIPTKLLPRCAVRNLSTSVLRWITWKRAIAENDQTRRFFRAQLSLHLGPPFLVPKKHKKTLWISSEGWKRYFKLRQRIAKVQIMAKIPGNTLAMVARWICLLLPLHGWLNLRQSKGLTHLDHLGYQQQAPLPSIPSDVSCSMRPVKTVMSSESVSLASSTMELNLPWKDKALERQTPPVLALKSTSKSSLLPFVRFGCIT